MQFANPTIVAQEPKSILAYIYSHTHLLATYPYTVCRAPVIYTNLY